MQLKRENEIGFGRREQWTCYEVLHAGENQCSKPGKIFSPRREIYPHEAAEEYARGMMESEMRSDGYTPEDGDRWHVAVETRPGFVMYFEVWVTVQYVFNSDQCDEP